MARTRSKKETHKSNTPERGRKKKPGGPEKVLAMLSGFSYEGIKFRSGQRENDGGGEYGIWLTAIWNSFKNPKTPAEHRLFNSFTQKIQADLKRDVITFSMQFDDDRINFRRQFIMLIAKCLFFPSPKATVSSIHIRATIDVSNPRKIYWARYIYDFLIDGVLRFQDVGKKTVDGCMFALLIIYFHANKNGDLERYNGREPWIRDWSLADLKTMDKEESTSYSMRHMIDI
ncbi:uncharacterized protein DS421_13g403580 [Arachis hypogaea]|nr:uncharacterized protein DS421_13g403580 [Arachis hypogaea]